MTGHEKLQKFQMGLELTAGTQVAATTILRGIGKLENKPTIVYPNENIGYLVDVNQPYIPKLDGGFKIDSMPATYEQLPWILAAGVKNVVTGVADGGGSGKIYAYPLSTTALNTLKTLSLEGGDEQQVEVGAYGYITDFEISGKAGESLMMAANGGCRQAKVNSYTASTIAFVAATKKITDSANGLAGFKTGMKITVTGTINNNGTFTIATGGVAAEIVVTETLVNESVGTAFTVEQTWSGATLPTTEKILFSLGKLYIDDAGGTLGATQKSNTFLSMSLKVNTGVAAVYTGDGNLFFSFTTIGKPSATLDITFLHDGSATAEKDKWRLSTARKIRMLFEGNTLTTAGTYAKKSFISDLAGKWEKFNVIASEDGNTVVSGSFKAAYDSVAALFASLTVVNELTAL